MQHRVSPQNIPAKRWICLVMSQSSNLTSGHVLCKSLAPHIPPHMLDRWTQACCCLRALNQSSTMLWVKGAKHRCYYTSCQSSFDQERQRSYPEVDVLHGNIYVSRNSTSMPQNLLHDCRGLLQAQNKIIGKVLPQNEYTASLLYMLKQCDGGKQQPGSLTAFKCCSWASSLSPCIPRVAPE